MEMAEKEIKNLLLRKIFVAHAPEPNNSPPHLPPLNAYPMKSAPTYPERSAILRTNSKKIEDAL